MSDAASPAESGQRRERSLPGPPEAALAALGEEVEAWGGSWRREGDGGELVVPVQAGLRVGQLRAWAAASPVGGACRLDLVEREAHWRLQAPGVAILGLAALASLAVVLWPFFPALLELLPLALVLAVAAWIFVVARLRNQGLEELLAAVAERLGEPAGRG